MSAQTEAQSEVLYLLLRRLRSLETELGSLPEVLEEIRNELAQVRTDLARRDGRTPESTPVVGENGGKIDRVAEPSPTPGDQSGALRVPAEAATREGD
jgi:hypothetical protein